MYAVRQAKGKPRKATQSQPVTQPSQPAEYNEDNGEEISVHDICQNFYPTKVFVAKILHKST